MIVLDTSALLFWTLDRKRLSANAKIAIEQSGRIAISSISIWEIGIKAKKGRLTLPVSIGTYVENLKRLQQVEIIPIDEKIWLENVALSWAHQDPADRTIVATAILLARPLITSDRVIRSFYQAAVW